MATDQSVTAWIEGLRAGQETAAAKLWNHFYQDLLALAWRRLQGAPRRAADEEDVVASALETFIRRAREGQFPRLNDRHDLWHLLVAITERKALNLARDQSRKKRGSGKVRDESALQDQDHSTQARGLDQIAGPEPTPETAAAMTEALGQLLGVLDAGLRQIALLKLEGRTNGEIASRIGRSTATVERRLRLIRDKWRGLLEDSASLAHPDS
jgi:RNA polymerase sigma factor (sigma-70 family)